jgi:tRNA pseudouridine55 synthase
MIILDKSKLESLQDWHEAALQEGAALLIDKEKSWTSFDVVAKVRKIAKIKKVGHAGTLDPLATGLLIICLGKATKKITEFQDMTKVYSGVMKLGAITNTFDTEGAEEDIKEVNVSEEEVIAAAKKLTGKLMQKPPMFSARKHKGKRLYKLARKDIKVEPAAKEIEVYNFDIIKFEKPFISFEIKCSKGTYIRALARDIGEILNTGGDLYSLRRESIGEYNADNAILIKDLQYEFERSKGNEKNDESL